MRSTSFLALVLSAASFAQVSPTKIDAIFAPLRSSNAPGAAVLVVRNWQTVFRRGYGVTDLRTLHPIDASTNFRLASFTKQFTATCIMLLVHDGKLRYDDHLTDIFPEFPAYGKSITVRNLLNHTSGLPDYEDILMKQYPNTPDEKIPQILDAGVLKLLEQQSAGEFAPGTKWEYSNSGYAVLAMIVEKVSGKPFGQFLRERIFAPLNIKNTLAYEKGKNEVPHRAYGHTKEKDAWRQTDQSPTSAVLGDGGIYSSIDDLAKWDRALRDHTLLSDAEMLPALTPVQLTDSPAKFPNGSPVSYGFGWFLAPYKGHKRMSHDGETIGFRTTIQRFPDDKLTVIVLANRSDINPEELALKVSDLYLSNKPQRSDAGAGAGKPSKNERDAASSVSQIKAECRLCRWRHRSRWWSRSCGRRGGHVDQILQFLAGLEERDLLGRHFHALTGLRVAADARLALAGAEAAKAANLDLVAGAQGAHHAVKDRFHDHFAVFPRKLRQTRDFVDQICFGHNAPSTQAFRNRKQLSSAAYLQCPARTSRVRM
jgi:CubicO group peptidase (beta-lactamase class C family)